MVVKVSRCIVFVVDDKDFVFLAIIIIKIFFVFVFIFVVFFVCFTS